MLLDSHVLLWVLSDSDRLGRRAADAIREAPAVLVSSMTVLELEIKAMLGRLRLPSGFADRLVAEGFVPAPFEHRHAATTSVFDSLVRHDPFDRALLAHAHAEGVPFVTADRRLLELELPFVVDATR